MNYFHNRQVLQRDFKRLMQKTRWKVFCEVTFTVLISFNERQKFCFTFLLKQVRTIRIQTTREWTQTYSFFSFLRILVYFFFPLILNCLRNPSFCGPIAEQAWANNCHISARWSTDWFIATWLSVQRWENDCSGLVSFREHRSETGHGFALRASEEEFQFIILQICTLLLCQSLPRTRSKHFSAELDSF